ncbi:LysM peptidoglycan-binding domain-containing protein [Paenibacillus cellulositrophicus]|uniref:LysM peptidoglycan-binding domain-containing protein n=1 Tax=Paenibacillus cellulositrophicus TaxID=562959 RepID=UPI003D96FDC1
MLKHTTYQSIYNNPSVNPSLNEAIASPWLKKVQSFVPGPALIKLILAALIILVGCTGVVRVFAGTSDDVRLEKNVIVQQGDTLWGIASAHKPEDMDIRAYIMAVKKYNDLTSSEIQAGEVLALPQY